MEICDLWACMRQTFCQEEIGPGRALSWVLLSVRPVYFFSLLQILSYFKGLNILSQSKQYVDSDLRDMARGFGGLLLQS